MAVRVASPPKERWVRRAAEWNPGFSTKIKTCRAVERLRKRWEDEVNDFFKPETEATNGSDVKKKPYLETGSKARRQMERKRRSIRGSKQKGKVDIQ